jgi:hypothetical protein
VAAVAIVLVLVIVLVIVFDSLCGRQGRSQQCVDFFGTLRRLPLILDRPLLNPPRSQS